MIRVGYMAKKPFSDQVWLKTHVEEPSMKARSFWAVVMAIAGSITGQGEEPLFRVRHTFQIEASYYFYAVVFSPNGKILASASNGGLPGPQGQIHLWKVVQGGEGTLLHRDWTPVYSVAFSPDGRTLASGGGKAKKPGEVQLWEVATGKKTSLSGHEGPVYAVAFSPDGQTLATASDDGTIRLWTVPREKTKVVLKGHTDSVTSLAFSPDGRLLASGSRDKTIKLWDVTTGREKATFKGEREIRSLAFFPNGKAIASASAGTTVWLWDTTTGQWTDSVGDGLATLECVAVSPDGQTLATGSDSGVVLWDLAQPRGKEGPLGPPKKGTLRGQNRRVYSVAFSPDGKAIAGGGDGGTIALWDVPPPKHKK